MVTVDKLCHILDIEHPLDRSTCIGYGKRSPTCRNTVAKATRIAATSELKHICKLMSHGKPNENRLADKLDTVAHFLHCRSRHQDQAESEAEQWSETVLDYMKSRRKRSSSSLRDAPDKALLKELEHRLRSRSNMLGSVDALVRKHSRNRRRRNHGLDEDTTDSETDDELGPDSGLDFIPDAVFDEGPESDNESYGDTNSQEPTSTHYSSNYYMTVYGFPMNLTSTRRRLRRINQLQATVFLEDSATRQRRLPASSSSQQSSTPARASSSSSTRSLLSPDTSSSSSQSSRRPTLSTSPTSSSRRSPTPLSLSSGSSARSIRMPTTSSTSSSSRHTGPLPNTSDSPSSDVEADCGICLAELSQDDNDNDIWRCTTCRNGTHMACFDAWMASSPENHVRCVYCRTEV